MSDFNCFSYFNNKFTFDNGVYTLGKAATVSFPENGYARCFTLEDDSFWFKHRNQCISLAVTRYSKGAVFFDVGGGNGKVAKYLQDQNIIARFLLNMDRGKNVRFQSEYEALVKPYFAHVKTTILSKQLRLPYNHIIMEISKDLCSTL